MRTFSAVGNGDQAQRLLLAEGDVDHARDRHAVVTAHAIVTETRGEMEKALELYGDAAERWADYGFVLEEGQAHLGGARCFLSLGDSAAATEPLLKARAIFERLGAVPLLNEADIYSRDTQTSTG